MQVSFNSYYSTDLSPCTLRILKHLVFCSTILTAHNTALPARLSIERSTISQTLNHFDERGKPWRGSVTICLSKLDAIRSQQSSYQHFLLSSRFTTADVTNSDVVDVFTLVPHSDQANNNLIPPPTTTNDRATPMDEEHTIKKHEPAPKEMMYRSVRAAPSSGHIWRNLNEDPKSWEAKAVMDGSGERA